MERYNKFEKPMKSGKPMKSAKPGRVSGFNKPENRKMDGWLMKSVKGRLQVHNELGSTDRFQGKMEMHEEDESGAGFADRIEGRNPVLEVLRSGRTIDKLFVSKGELEGSIRQIMALARQKGIVVQEVERAKLDVLSSTKSHQGIVAFVAAKAYVELEDILEIAAGKGEKPFIIILDEITDPQNLGSIIRTADAVGAHGIVIPKRRASGLSAIVAKASAGAIEYVSVAKVTNLSQAIDTLKKNGVWIVGTDAGGREPFYKMDFKVPVAIIVGSEGEGIGKLLKEKCDFIANIPMKGSMSSLNASVAGAVAMYEVMRQRL